MGAKNREWGSDGAQNAAQSADTFTRAENESNQGKWDADNSRWKQAVEQDRTDVRDADAQNWDRGSQRQGYDSVAAKGQNYGQGVGAAAGVGYNYGTGYGRLGNGNGYGNGYGYGAGYGNGYG